MRGASEGWQCQEKIITTPYKAVMNHRRRFFGGGERVCVGIGEAKEGMVRVSRVTTVMLYNERNSRAMVGYIG